MLRVEAVVSFVSRKSISSMAYLILLIFPLIPLAGCSGEGAGGPIISSLSAPTDTTTELDSDLAQDSKQVDSDSGGEEDFIITMTATPTGVTTQLTWDYPSDANVTRYYIYYRKQPSPEAQGSEEPSSCSYEDRQAVEAPPATITGLEPNTPYFFAISASNESESLCSNEIMAITPPVQS